MKLCGSVSTISLKVFSHWHDSELGHATVCYKCIRTHTLFNVRWNLNIYIYIRGMQSMGSHQKKWTTVSLSIRRLYPHHLRKMTSLIAPRSLADASKSQQITHKILESKRADLKPQPCHVVAMCLPFWSFCFSGSGVSVCMCMWKLHLSLSLLLFISPSPYLYLYIYILYVSYIYIYILSTYQIKRHSIQWVRDKSYLTSSDPTLTHYSDIVSDKVLEVYVWNLFWHYFWHSIWHLVWHSVWHTLWHLFWPYFWHLLWHSIWHLFWHSIWHSFWQILWHSCNLFGIYSDRHPYWQTFPGVVHSILRFRYGSGPLVPTVTPRYAGQAEEVDDDFIKIERPSLTGQVGEKEETLFRTVMPLICDFHVFFSQRSGVIFLQRSEVWICRTSCGLTLQRFGIKTNQRIQSAKEQHVTLLNELCYGKGTAWHHNKYFPAS